MQWHHGCIIREKLLRNRKVRECTDLESISANPTHSTGSDEKFRALGTLWVLGHTGRSVLCCEPALGEHMDHKGLCSNTEQPELLAGSTRKAETRTEPQGLNSIRKTFLQGKHCMGTVQVLHITLEVVLRTLPLGRAVLG